MSIFDEIEVWEKTEGKGSFAALADTSEPVILDYGCGAGNYSFACAYAFDQKCRIYAADIKKQILDQLNEKAAERGISCINAVMGREDYRHDFDDDTFDIIIYSDIFHGEEKIYGGLHRFVMIEEAHRTLKKGGVMAVLPFHLSNFRNKEKKKCKYTYKKLIDEISGMGFEYAEKNLEGIHFEKAYSPYYQQKGGIGFDDLERGKMLIFKVCK